MRAHRKAKEEEVRAAYKVFRKASKKDRRTPIVIELQTCRLYSSEHMNRISDGAYVEFYHLDDSYRGKHTTQNNGRKETEKLLDGQLTNSIFRFGNIPTPTHASRTSIHVETYHSKHHILRFFGKDYIKLRLLRELVLPTQCSTEALAQAPEIFKFLCIRRDLKEKQEERKERKKVEEEKKRNAPPSPRESWFEMNHPMGSWAQS